jgi:hypothetical protein
MRQHRHAVIVLALQRLRRRLRQKIRAQGYKLPEYSARDLRLLVEQYFDQHRDELIAEATATVEHWTAEGKFGKQAQRDWFAKVSSDAQKEKAQKSITSAVQMLGAE